MVKRTAYTKHTYTGQQQRQQQQQRKKHQKNPKTTEQNQCEYILGQIDFAPPMFRMLIIMLETL